MSPVELASLIALTAVGLALTAPQTWLLLRGGVAAGVSVPGLLCSVISYLAWAGFAVEVHDRVFVLSLVLPGALEVLTLALAVRYHGEWHGWWVALLWALAVCAATALGREVLGALLAGSIVWEYGPPAWEAWHAPDVSGVSVGAWRVRVADGVMWTAYGAVAAHVELLVAGGAAAVLAVVVLAGLRAPLPIRVVSPRERSTASATRIGLDPPVA